MLPKIKKAYAVLAKSVTRRGYKKLVLARADVAHDRVLLPYDDETFGTIVALGPLGFSKSIEQSLCEVHRVLRPGGKAAIAVWTRRGRYYERPQFYFDEREFAAAVDKWFEKQEHSVLHRQGPSTLRAVVVTKAK